MSEERSREEKNKLDRLDRSAAPVHADEASLLRPSGVAPPAPGDQLSYNYGNYGQGGGEEGFNVRELWRKVRKHKLLVLSVLLIATTIVTVEAFRTPSTYQATCKVALNRDNATVVKFGDAIFETDDTARIKNDLLLLNTYPLLEEVVVRLKLDQDPNFLSVGERKTVLEAVRTISNKFKFGGGVPVATPDASQPVSAAPLQQTERTAEESARLAPYVGVLQSYLISDQIPETHAINISFTHTDPVMAARVANGVADVFVAYSYNSKTAKYTKSATWLNTTTRKLLAQMQDAEQQLANYSQANNFFSTDDTKQSPTVEKFAELNGQALKAETERLMKQSLYEEVKQGRVAQLPEAFSDARTVQLQTRIGDMQVELSKLSERYGPENPKVIEMQREITSMQQLLAQGSKNLEAKLKADYERALRDERLIQESLARARAEAVQQNQASIKFGILKQNVDTAKSLYNDFLQKTNQADIQLNEQNNDLRVIEPARVPGGPVGPRRMRAILIGMLLSLAGGVGLALLLEYLDNTVKSIEDVTRATNLPTLALIPSMNAQALRTIGKEKAAAKSIAAQTAASSKGAGKEAIAGIAPRSMHPQGNKVATLSQLSTVVEAYRMLRTSVLLSTAGTPPKTILVTSSQPGEGKTTTAVNTAISLAQLGASVLVIDADLRRPAIHKAFKIPHTRGVSNFLSSKTPIENLIVKLPIPNLSVLTCGPIPPNPAELISSDRMKEMLRILSERYDHIIIDSPPLISVTDPVILSTLVDGSILVVQSGKSTRELVRRARQELAGVGGKIFGVVLNNVDVRREGYDEYYYYRYYTTYGEQAKSA